MPARRLPIAQAQVDNGLLFFRNRDLFAEDIGVNLHPEVAFVSRPQITNR